MCSRYRYVVKFSGIGDPPSGNQHLGHCSQMAIFTRCSASPNPPVTQTSGLPYVLVAEESHPFSPALTSIESLSREAQYYLRVLEKLKLKDMRDDESPSEILIPLAELLVYKKVSKLCSSVDELRTALCHSGSVHLDPSGEFVVIQRQAEPDDDDNSSSEERHTCDGKELAHLFPSTNTGHSEPEPDW